MNTYMVYLKAKPSPGSEEFGEVGGAYIHCYVQSESIADAAQKAVAFVMGRLWVVTEQIHALLMTPERIALMDEAENATYQRAQLEGLHSYFLAWPINEREEDIFEIRGLKDVDKFDGSTH